MSRWATKVKVKGRVHSGHIWSVYIRATEVIVRIGQSVVYDGKQIPVSHLHGYLASNVVLWLFPLIRYNAVLEACCLLPDLAELPYGDMTEVSMQPVANP